MINPNAILTRKAGYLIIGQIKPKIVRSSLENRSHHLSSKFYTIILQSNRYIDLSPV